MAFSNARAKNAAQSSAAPTPASLPATPSPDDAPGSGTQADLVRRMSSLLATEKPETTSAALRLLRQEFSDYPLALRLAGLAASMRYWP